MEMDSVAGDSAVGGHEEQSRVDVGSVPAPRSVAGRWTYELAESWTPVSDFFLKFYGQMKPKITTIEAMFIIQLVSFKFDTRYPSPSFETIAKRMGVSHQSVRDYCRKLVRKKYLRRIMGNWETNKYDLNPLFEKLEAALFEQRKVEGKRMIRAETAGLPGLLDCDRGTGRVEPLSGASKAPECVPMDSDIHGADFAIF